MKTMNDPFIVDSKKDLNRTGYIHIAFSLGCKERFDELILRLKEGVYIIVSGLRATDYGYYESSELDIEGNQRENILI
ncbi:hypothetical protein [Peptostreptococcus stomatis]